MTDLVEGIAFLGRVLLKVLLVLARAVEFLSFLSEVGDLIAGAWRRLRGTRKPDPQK